MIVSPANSTCTGSLSGAVSHLPWMSFRSVVGPRVGVCSTVCGAGAGAAGGAVFAASSLQPTPAIRHPSNSGIG
jgi:hypothetical protein